MKQLALLLLSLTLVACSPLKPVKLSQVQTYTLTSVSYKKLAETATKKTLLVSMPTASPGYQSSQMIYIDNPYQLESFSKNRWVAAPTQMLLPLVTQSLRNTGYYHAVVSTPFAGLTDLRLDTQILQLQQEFLTRPSSIRLVIQATLSDNVRNNIIATRRFQMLVPTKANTPYAGVLATNQAVQQFLEQVVVFSVAESKTLTDK